VAQFWAIVNTEKGMASIQNSCASTGIVTNIVSTDIMEMPMPRIGASAAFSLA
jgi:hypothetical protein